MARKSMIEFRLRAGENLISVEDYRKAARRRLPRMVWTYVDGGAEDLVGVNGNRAAFDQWALRWSVLKGYGTPDLSTTVAGVALSLPVLLAPTGFTGLSNWRGDVAIARGAERAGTRYAVSTSSSWSLEEVAQATNETHFFQLYPQGTSTEVSAAIAGAQANGYKVLILTVDAAARGSREGERRNGMGVPPVLTPGRIIEGALHPRWAFNFMFRQRIAAPALTSAANVPSQFRPTGKPKKGLARASEAIEELEKQMMPTLNWDDIKWMRDQWDGKVLVKGIMNADDAREAVKAGMDGIIVSNHGGRQLDHSEATISALPAIVEAVGDQIEVLIDSGFRRGTDILKALALGAKAVFVGRPYIYGLAVNGEDGVYDVIEILRDELIRDMILCGVKDVHSVDRSILVPRVGDLHGLHNDPPRS